VPVEQQGARMEELIASGATAGAAAETEIKRQQAVKTMKADAREKGGKADKAGKSTVDEVAEIEVPGKRDLRKLLEALVEADAEKTAQARMILGFVLDGTPLKGPVRQAWKSLAK
jgi:hypothetical protein